MRIKSASFEPRRMREALKKLKDLEKEIDSNRLQEREQSFKKQAPTFWVRCWHWFFKA
ncbi:hypothetical protein [Nitratifractor sp.]